MKYKKSLSILFWIFAWQLLALAINNPILFAGPLETVRVLLILWRKISFWQIIGFSLLRIGTGFLAGFFCALLLAGVSARFSLLEEALRPLMVFLKAVPVASFVVLLLIWWGSSLLAVSICFLVVLPNIYIHTLEGMKSMDRQILEMARVFDIPFRNRFFYIYRPALRPFLYGSMKVSLGMCWKSGVAAEVIGVPDLSIGEQLYLSKIELDIAGVFAWTTVVIVLSIFFEKLVLYLTGRFFSWEPLCRKAGQTETAKVPLVCKKVYKSFGNQMVINGVSAEYLPGRTYYLTEPSGSGKTTLLRLLCGLEKPDSGQIGWEGRSMETDGRFSMVFQEDRLCEEYSAIRNVEMVTGDRKQAEEALLRLLDKEALHKPCSQLSGGMKRRVALVRAMEAETDAILLDEPFTGMDEVSRMAAEEYIKRKQGSRVVIIATHLPTIL